MLRRVLLAVQLLLVAALAGARAADLAIDGVPIPADAASAGIPATATDLQRQWSGAWVGAWGGVLKHILLVESIDQHGAARIIYAVGDNPYAGVRAGWSRLDAVASGHTLTVTGTGFTAIYDMGDDGKLSAVYRRGNGTSRATMSRADLASLTKAGAVVAWTGGRSEFLKTDLVEDGAPIELETVIFKPSGPGPFPLAVFNHGSTGMGRNPALFRETWSSTEIAEFLNRRGWLVAFPQRRGRGKSDGLYDEGFGADRGAGYTCDTDATLRGADRALTDIDAAIKALRQRGDVAPGPALIGGQSRGGVLSVAYAGVHAEQTFGVINFVGGWLGQGCPTSEAVNQTLFRRGAPFARPTVWLYADRDMFYSLEHSRKNFSAFEAAGGQGKFITFDTVGHGLYAHPDLWSAPVSEYLNSLAQGH